MRNSVMKGLQNLYYRVMTPYWQSEFTPYIGNVAVGEISFHFFYGTSLSRSWYDPIKPYAMAEYLWVQQNVTVAGQRVIDGGAHHGHYSSYFAALGGFVTAVDPLSSNIALTTVNAAINQFDIKVVQAALSDQTGHATFIPRSNGKLFAGVGIRVPTTTLIEIDPDATVVKLDIEGAEFRILPNAIDMMPKTTVWIIEAHARAGNLQNLVKEFSERGFAVFYLEKKMNKIIPFLSESFEGGTTSIFCIR